MNFKKKNQKYASECVYSSADKKVMSPDLPGCFLKANFFLYSSELDFLKHKKH